MTATSDNRKDNASINILAYFNCAYRHFRCTRGAVVSAICAFRRSRTAFRNAPEQANELANTLILFFLLRKVFSFFAMGYGDHSTECPALAASTKSVFDHARNAVRIAPEFRRNCRNGFLTVSFSQGALPVCLWRENPYGLVSCPPRFTSRCPDRPMRRSSPRRNARFRWSRFKDRALLPSPCPVDDRGMNHLPV